MVAWLLCSLAGAGCGQLGPLYLPEPVADPGVPTTPEQEESETASD